MNKKQNVAIVMTSLLSASIMFAAGSRAIADDLNVTAPLTISSSQTNGRNFWYGCKIHFYE